MKWSGLNSGMKITKMQWNSTKRKEKIQKEKGEWDQHSVENINIKNKSLFLSSIDNKMPVDLRVFKWEREEFFWIKIDKERKIHRKKQSLLRINRIM